MPYQRHCWKPSGFTLIELMITVAIIGILAAIAYPSYREYMFKSRRADAHAALMNIEMEQQKRRASGLGYVTTTTAWSALGFPTTSTDGYYSLTLASVTSGGYTATASPTGIQSSDSCGNISFSVNATGTAQYLPNARCWGR